jgi:hypothetical protein
MTTTTETKKIAISLDDLIYRYDEMLDEVYPQLFNMYPSRILEEMDPIMYRCGYLDYYDSISDEYYCDDLE